MSADFKDAAGRHAQDADSLLTLGRWPNADHLAGLAAECALKSVMLSMGMPVDSTGTPTDQQHKVHIDKLWPVFIGFCTARSGAAYAAQLSAVSPFADWKVHQRYEAQGAIPQAVATAHVAAASQCMAILNQAILDGVV